MKDKEWYGRLPRSPPRQSREFKDERFVRFCQEQYFLKIPDSVWRIPVFSPVAQYDEFAKFLQPRPALSTFCEQKLIDKAMSFTYRHYAFVLRNAGFLTWEEAYARTRKEASAGYPENIKFWSKKDLAENGDWFAKYVQDIRSWSTPAPLPSVFQQNAKWELRKVGKSTRTFLPGPANLHMYQVQKFAQQNDALVENQRHLWFGCGLSPFKGGWNRLFTEFKNFGTEYFESDVSGWDRSVSPDLRWAIMQLRFMWLPKHLQTVENLREMSRSYDLAINAWVVLEEGDLTRKYGGTSSGEFNTLDDNCLLHTLVLYLVLVRMKPDITYEEIMANFRFKLVGDDNFGSVKMQNISSWFSWEKFQKGYEDLGFTIKYIKHSTDIMEREFLSLRAVYRWGMIVGVPDFEKVICSMTYGNHYDDVQYRLLRALDFRMYCFGNEKLFALLDAWCETLYKENRAMCEREGTDFPWSTIKGNWKTVGELLLLHCGYE